MYIPGETDLHSSPKRVVMTSSLNSIEKAVVSNFLFTMNKNKAIQRSSIKPKVIKPQKAVFKENSRSPRRDETNFVARPVTIENGDHVEEGAW
jgi:3-deoxy-D-arabino-heptulosonate 7-phosphate (DAHP) synthase